MTATTTAPATLAELNVTPYRSVWANTYEIEHLIAVGRSGSSCRGTSGSKVHLLFVQRIVGEPNGHKPGTFGIGENFSVVGACNGNGQNTGVVMPKHDTTAITCEKCLKRLAAIIERRAQRAVEVVA